MKEIVTLLSCLPFTGGCSSILPITSGNFYLFFIVFIVVFFLLGIIIGYMLNPRRKLSRTKEKPLIEAAKEVTASPVAPGQDITRNDAEPQLRTDNRALRDGNYYNNYWDYSNPKRRY